MQPELSAMWGLATHEAEAGHAVTAARLLGWVNERRSRLGARSDAEDIEFEDRLRDMLARDRFAAELAAGAALRREDAIDLALGQSDSA